jgi:PEGA domain
VRRRATRVTQLVVVAATLSLLWPAPAHAGRHGPGRPHRAVVVRAAYGGPYFYPGFFYPGFYYPGFYYSAFVGPFGWYGHPWGAWGPWPAYGYYDATSSARIQGAPPQAEVYVDGYYAGIVDDFDGTFQRLRVPPGEHEVVIYLEGYRSTKQNILFRPRAGYKINASLEKLADGEQAEPRPEPSATANPQGTPPPRPHRDDRDEQRRGAQAEASGFGTLSVRVQPAGASILVDGERWEGSDTTGERLLVQLAEGRHRVEVQREGYKPYTTEVDVRSGETATLNVSLPQERP